MMLQKVVLKILSQSKYKAGCTKPGIFNYINLVMEACFVKAVNWIPGCSFA